NGQRQRHRRGGVADVLAQLRQSAQLRLDAGEQRLEVVRQVGLRRALPVVVVLGTVGGDDRLLEFLAGRCGVVGRGGAEQHGRVGALVLQIVHQRAGVTREGGQNTGPVRGAGG